MKALVDEAPEVRKLREFDPPSPGADEVVSRVAYSGICRCVLSGFMGQNSLRGAPRGFGHGLSGWIDSGGERVPAHQAYTNCLPTR